MKLIDSIEVDLWFRMGQVQVQTYDFLVSQRSKKMPRNHFDITNLPP